MTLGEWINSASSFSVHQNIVEGLHKEMNMDLPEQVLAYSKSSMFLLFWISFFLSFLPSLGLSFLSPSLLLPPPDPPLTKWIQFWRPNWIHLQFISGHRYFELFVFQLTLMFSNLGYVSCWKTGPSQELLAATDWFGWEPFLPWQAVEESHSVCAGSNSHSLRLDCSPESLPTQLHLPWDGDILFQLRGYMLPWKWNEGALGEITLSFAHTLCQIWVWITVSLTPSKGDEWEEGPDH